MNLVYKLIPPRPTFALDMTETEQGIMGEHAAYWNGLYEQGFVVVFGVVIAWRLKAVVCAGSRFVPGRFSTE